MDAPAVLYLVPDLTRSADSSERVNIYRCKSLSKTLLSGKTIFLKYIYMY